MHSRDSHVNTGEQDSVCLGKGMSGGGVIVFVVSPVTFMSSSVS